MKKQQKIIIPSYAEDFKCIGGECEDSCCIGWDIDVDKKSFKKYFRTKNKEMKNRFSRHIGRNRESYDYNVDYGRIAIKDNKWCPFLNENRLCDIFRNLGEDFLSNVCHSFPRVYNVLNGTYELSLYMSCPEAVRKLLSCREPIRFIERDMQQVKHIVNSSIDSQDKYWRNTPFQRLPELRALSIEIIQNRALSIKDRLLDLGNRMEKIALSDSVLQAPAEEPEGIKDIYGFRIEFFQYVIESLGVIDKIDSPVFADFTSLVLKMFTSGDNSPSNAKRELYRETAETELGPFAGDNEYVFEHYLVNSMYQDNFPFSENHEIFDGYVLLVVRYALVKFYLAGIAAENKKLTISDFALMIQVHTKMLNHHKTFSFNILQEIKRKQYDNMEYISLLLE